MHSPTFTSCYCARVLKVFRFLILTFNGRKRSQDDKWSDWHLFSSINQEPAAKSTITLTASFVLCEKRHNHIFIIMRDDESMEKGEKAHKALFVYSISFGQSKCSMKFALFFWKIMHGLKRCPKLPCVFLKMDELEENDVRGICLLHTFEGIEGH